MKEPIFRGSATAIVTPFNSFGDVDVKAFAELIKWQIEEGTQGIVVTGTTGENPTVADEEFELLIKTAVKMCKGKIPVIAGTGRNDTSKSISLSKKAWELGADALLVVTPYYNKTTQKGLVAHATAIADSTSIPVILYNVPSRTGMSFTADTYKILSSHPLINGVKEASGNFTLMLQTLASCPKDFYLYCGNDDQITAMLSLGAQGVISVLSNIAPRDVQEICAAFDRGEAQKSLELQTKYSRLIDALFVETNPIPVKAALEFLGKCGGKLRLPLVEIGQSNRELLFAEMKNAGLI